ncbi:aspartyl-phosphate phosphatase Spo0E family protein [Shouchella shacheensis]|uniref:aspartyl-phosphate phosphatase Spo0E family protein n=1 Tax=Shouchella shacheensis TaxID=1649580 RepID=UPI0009EB8835|nr:aspartyl-phosphate phosphatase Spo0E family protein [Shouchella shacheensis]
MIQIDIEAKRNEMLCVANKYGMNARKTVKCSQELDVLLNCVQFYRMQNRG